MFGTFVKWVDAGCPQHRLQIVGGVPGPGTSGPTTSGQLVNINTASADEMRQSLHISTTTAQSIVNYRQQNGQFTSIDQLQLVISTSIYTRIKGLITI